MLSTANSFQNVAVDVSPLNSVSPTPCAKIQEAVKPGSLKSVKCSPGSEGRYVTISFTGRRRVLSLAQILVYGESGMLIRQQYYGTTSIYGIVSPTVAKHTIRPFLFSLSPPSIPPSPLSLSFSLVFFCTLACNAIFL